MMARQLPDLDTATHVAGQVITVGGRSIQRCPVCGEKLADTGDPSGPIIPWLEGELIKAECGFLHRAGGTFLDTKRFPGDFCLALVR